MTKKDGHGLAAYGYKIFFKSSQRGKIENKMMTSSCICKSSHIVLSISCKNPGERKY